MVSVCFPCHRLLGLFLSNGRPGVFDVCRDTLGVLCSKDGDDADNNNDNNNENL